MNWKTWLKGLAVAVGSALFTSGVAYLTAPQTFNFSKAGLVRAACLAVPIAAKAVSLYLAQSPIPKA